SPVLFFEEGPTSLVGAPAVRLEPGTKLRRRVEVSRLHRPPEKQPQRAQSAQSPDRLFDPMRKSSLRSPRSLRLLSPGPQSPVPSRSLQQRDLAAVIGPMLNDTIQHHRDRILLPGDHGVELNVLQAARHLGEFAMARRKPLDVARPCLMTSIGRRPVLLRRRIDDLAAKAALRDLCPGRDVPNDLPDAVGTRNRPRVGAVVRHTIEQIREGRPVPHRARYGPFDPIRYLRRTGHKPFAPWRRLCVDTWSETAEHAESAEQRNRL